MAAPIRRLSALLLAIGLLAVMVPSVAAKDKSDVSPMYYPTPYRVYIVDNIYNRYDGTYGDKSTGIGCVGPCTTSITVTYGWSNSWGASISFTRPPIEAAVNFNVTLTGSVAYTNTFAVPSGRSGVIHYKDYYHVTQMHVHNCMYDYVKYYDCVYGTAWAQKWYQRLYYVVLS